MSERACHRLRIRGVVQGVGYRYAMQQEAMRLGVDGWVRNRLDGSVEAVVSGPATVVEAIVAWSRRGPAAARVDDVSVATESGDFTGFEAKPTA